MERVVPRSARIRRGRRHGPSRGRAVDPAARRRRRGRPGGRGLRPGRGRRSGAWRRRRSWSWPWPASRCWVRSPRWRLLAAVSGGLHLDGLADTADALVAPDAYAAERAREDPSVGPGGAVALLVVLGAEVAALASRDGVVGARGGRVGRRRGRRRVALAAGARGRAPAGPGRTRRPRRLVQRRRLGSRRDRRGGHDRDPGRRPAMAVGGMGARVRGTDRRGGRPGRDGVHRPVARAGSMGTAWARPSRSR